jgi:methionyl-tRNA synthetase
MTFGADGVYNEEALVSRINSDLANDLGNLLSRTLAMVEKYFGGCIPTQRKAEDVDDDLKARRTETPGLLEGHMDKLELSNGLSAVWKLISRANKYIDETAPWVLGKDPAKADRLAEVMFNLAETLRYVTVMIGPFMPKTAMKMKDQLQIPEAYLTWESLHTSGEYGFTQRMEKKDNLFPRVEWVSDDQEEIKAKPTSKTKHVEKTLEEPQVQEKETITIDEFAKVQLKTGTVVECTKHPDADRLLILQVQLGDEVRQIVSGIAAYYTPEGLVGKKVVVVTNLKKTKLRGIESNGMILAAADGSTLNLVTIDGDLPSGTEVR